MANLGVRQSTLSKRDGPRPVDLKSDLAPLADLIELVFADKMDSSGRAAINEMRQLSRIGTSVGMLAGLNQLISGIQLGYVWIADGKLVGNVSVYQAQWPSEMGKAWIVANVGVHPDYQRHGIARYLMQASMELIRERGGTAAFLQVDADNHTAQRLYRGLDFVDERTWITWRRNSSAHLPPPLTDHTVSIARRRASEWQAEYALAQRLRPQERGGLGWQQPLQVRRFRDSLLKRLVGPFNFRSLERLVIHAEDHNQLAASMWIESGLMTSGARLTLMVEPQYQGVYDDALIAAALWQHNGSALIVEHPQDETETNRVLEHYRFFPRRTVTHMRWDVR